jgi:hypothetical protein
VRAFAGQDSRTPASFFIKDDSFLVPISLLWGGFMMLWEAEVAGLLRPRNPNILLVLIGIPFVVAAQYLIWGRFLHAAWKKKRTFYAVTTRRVIVVQHGLQRQTASANIDALPTLTRENGPNRTGTVRFAKWEMEHPGARQLGFTRFDVMAIGRVPTFLDIDDVDSVYRLISDLQMEARVQRTTA